MVLTETLLTSPSFPITACIATFVGPPVEDETRILPVNEAEPFLPIRARRVLPLTAATVRCLPPPPTSPVDRYLLDPSSPKLEPTLVPPPLSPGTAAVSVSDAPSGWSQVSPYYNTEADSSPGSRFSWTRRIPRRGEPEGPPPSDPSSGAPNESAAELVAALQGTVQSVGKGVNDNPAVAIAHPSAPSYPATFTTQDIPQNDGAEDGDKDVFFDAHNSAEGLDRAQLHSLIVDAFSSFTTTADALGPGLPLQLISDAKEDAFHDVKRDDSPLHETSAPVHSSVPQGTGATRNSCTLPEASAPAERLLPSETEDECPTPSQTSFDSATSVPRPDKRGVSLSRSRSYVVVTNSLSAARQVDTLAKEGIVVDDVFRQHTEMYDLNKVRRLFGEGSDCKQPSRERRYLVLWVFGDADTKDFPLKAARALREFDHDLFIVAKGAQPTLDRWFETTDRVLPVTVIPTPEDTRSDSKGRRIWATALASSGPTELYWTEATGIRLPISALATVQRNALAVGIPKNGVTVLGGTLNRPYGTSDYSVRVLPQEGTLILKVEGGISETDLRFAFPGLDPSVWTCITAAPHYSTASPHEDSRAAYREHLLRCMHYKSSSIQNEIRQLHRRVREKERVAVSDANCSLHAFWTFLCLLWHLVGGLLFATARCDYLEMLSSVISFCAATSVVAKDLH
ncbi:unnamed protein product [Amoebophrya sp. A25]|nr:unnamed protein product [Amoebophrya sp. A25]|eukprot:GSA25T00012974001.1